MDPVGERLWKLLAGSGGVRLRHEAVLKLWYDDDASGSRAGSLEATDQLIGLLADLEVAGRLRRSRRRTDRGLPTQVTLLDLPPRAARPAPHGWREELAWAVEREPPEPLRSRLVQINEWLRDRPRNLPAVPMRERSLEIFGSSRVPEAEKLLERILKTVCGPGRTDPRHFKILQMSMPFPRERMAGGTALLVAENTDTYHSLVRAARERRPPPVDVVGFGEGNRFLRTITSADDHLQRLHYFGDLDRKGLAIPIEAQAKAFDVRPLEVVPAAPLYRALLARGVPSAAKGGPVPLDEAERLAAWLPPDMREPVARLLAAGQRLAQEWVGYQALRELDSWIDTT